MSAIRYNGQAPQEVQGTLKEHEGEYVHAQEQEPPQGQEEPQEPEPPQETKIYVILDENNNVTGYTTDETDLEITNEEHAMQLSKPGVYSWNGETFDFAEYTQPEKTEQEQEDMAESTDISEKAEAVHHVAVLSAGEVSKGAEVDDIIKISPLYPRFESLIGEFVDKEKTPYLRHEGEIYLLNQSHELTEQWTPGTAGTEALFSKVAKPGTVAAWVQPLGEHDAYNKPGSGLPKSDPVSHNGKIWESEVNSNIWEPGVYGWKEL